MAMQWADASHLDKMDKGFRFNHFHEVDMNISRLAVPHQSSEPVPKSQFG